MNNKRSILVLLVGFSIITSGLKISYISTDSIAGFPDYILTNYIYDPFKTEENPLRGFFPYIDEYDSFPHSMEFFYIPLKYLMNGFNSYTFHLYLEPWLNEIASRNHQAIFRVYLDHPDEPSGIPDFLLNGLTTYSYSDYGGGICPDYTNETLISALENFIAVFGEQYDGDIRIGFLQIGLLGFWGEWHTYPHDEWFPGPIIQNRILHAFEYAFNSTKIVVRYPAADSPQLNIGYHDDSFAYETIGSEDWQFYNRLINSNEEEKWKTQPIGGEIYPSIQKDLWDDLPPSIVQDFETCVSLTHASWLLNQEQFDTHFSKKKMQRAREGALLLGYQFFIPSVEARKTNSSLEISLQMKNTGNAPFYYPLELKVDIKGSFIEIENYSTIIPYITLLPNELQVYNFTLPIIGLANGTKIAFKLDSPHINRPIVFANEGVNEDGTLDLLPKITPTAETTNIPIITGITIIGVMDIVFKKKRNE